MDSIDKRYQVFVSSTYKDLIDERKEVMQALLELDCIPSGMELFQASDDDQWTVIKSVIDDCDYYMVIIAGRYGSVGSSGISYTEMEYRYAVEQGKPVIAFLHEEPGKLEADRTEIDPVAREQLQSFRNLCENKMVKYWSGSQGLGSVVSRSIVKLKKERPAVGWIRGSAIASADANREILRLRQKIDDLEAKIRLNATVKPEGTDDLLQDGDDIPSEATVSFQSLENRFTSDTFHFRISIPWNSIFSKISPRLLEEISEDDLESAIDAAFFEHLRPKLLDSDKYKERRINSITSTSDAFHKIKVQLIALGLMAVGEKKRPVSDSKTYWKLTPYGETKMMASLAMRRPKIQNDADDKARIENQ